MTRHPRDPYKDVGERVRHAIETAATHDLTPTQHRALLAVIHLTTTRSRHGDHVWLGQIADLTYGTRDAEPWQLEKTRKALVALRSHGIIDTVPPRGRPAEPAYYIGFPNVPAQPAPGPDGNDPAQPSTGLHNDPPAQPSTGPGRNASTARQQAERSTARSRPQHSPFPGSSTARSRALAQPAAGPPTEVLPRVTEEVPSGGRRRNGSAGATPNGSAPDEGWGRNGPPPRNLTFEQHTELRRRIQHQDPDAGHELTTWLLASESRDPDHNGNMPRATIDTTWTIANAYDINLGDLP